MIHNFSAVCYLTKLRSFLKDSKLLGIMDLRIGTVAWISGVGKKSQCFVNESCSWMSSKS